MKVVSYRHGFANNSSSSHSIILINNKDKFDSIKDDGESEFGWNYFTVKDYDSKLRYLLITLIDNLSMRISVNANSEIEWSETTKYRNQIIYDLIVKSDYFFIDNRDLKLEDSFKQLFNEFLSDDKYGDHGLGYIDHQSVITLPLDNKDKISIPFFNDLVKELLFSNYLILGGNDNDEESHYLSDSGDTDMKFIINFLLGKTDDRPERFKVIKDNLNNDWVLQDKYYGSIVRLTFDDKKEPTKKSEFPTLIDMKITDFCDFGCKFCYMSSTESGKHLKEWTHQDKSGYLGFRQLVDGCKENNVLEIVLGGGEPTKHPLISSFVSYIHQKGIICGVTTKNYDLDKTIDKNLSVFLSNVDTLAISCNSIVDLEKAKELYTRLLKLRPLNDSSFKIPKIYIQNILEISSLDYLEKFLDKCKELYFNDVNLLGYKTFGFGETYSTKYEYDSSWIDMVKAKKLNIGIDSIVVKRWKADLIEKGVNYRYLVGEEGKFSAYIDGMKSKIYSSSFTNDNGFILDNKNINEQIKTAFETF